MGTNILGQRRTHKQKYKNKMNRRTRDQTPTQKMLLTYLLVPQFVTELEPFIPKFYFFFSLEQTLDKDIDSLRPTFYFFIYLFIYYYYYFFFFCGCFLVALLMSSNFRRKINLTLNSCNSSSPPLTDVDQL